MVDTVALQQTITNRLDFLDKIINDYEVTKQNNLAIQKQLTDTTDLVKMLEATSAILAKASDDMRKQAKDHFEKIVTDALQFITQDLSYKFIIEEQPPYQGKPAYEFFVESNVNGISCKLKPESSCGGGFVDIISVTLQYAYEELFSNPKTGNATMLMDEPGKMVSELRSVKFSQYIKFLGKEFKKQSIMITHNENLANVADATFLVTQKNGVSSVSEIKNITDAEILNDIENILNGGSDDDAPNN